MIFKLDHAGENSLVRHVRQNLAHVRDHVRRFYGNCWTLLLLAEPNAYGADTNFLYFPAFYFEKWKQRIKVNGFYNHFDQFFSGVPKVPYQFHHYLKYTFMIFFCIGDLDIISCADDIKPYIYSSEIDVTLKKLQSYTIKISDGFITIAWNPTLGNKT